MSSDQAAPAPRARILVGVDVNYFTPDGAFYAAGYFSKAFATQNGRTVRAQHIAAYLRGVRDNAGPGRLPGLGNEKESGWPGSIVATCFTAWPSTILIPGAKAADYGSLPLADQEELDELRHRRNRADPCCPFEPTTFRYQMEPPGAPPLREMPAPGSLDQDFIYTYPTGYKFSLCYNHYHRPAEVLWANGAYALVEFVAYGDKKMRRLYRGSSSPHRYTCISPRKYPQWLARAVNEVGVVL